jgi:hypothetical protein
MTRVVLASTGSGATMNADLMQRPAIGWIVIVEEEEDDWLGVYDCGAIFKPSESVFLAGDRDDWPLEQCS